MIGKILLVVCQLQSWLEEILDKLCPNYPYKETDMNNPDLILLHAPSVYDFRNEAILSGPVSDMVPSTTVFEMYPIGFTSMAEYLDRHGYQARIINLAVRMLYSRDFNVESYLAGLDPLAFGIDLHWLPHAHGSIEVARIIKRVKPNHPVIFGGFSSTYFHEELIRYSCVDFILRGDSTELPLLVLMKYLKSGGSAHPGVGSPDYRRIQRIPNLVWKDHEGNPCINPISHVPDNLDDQEIDYTHIMRSVIRYRDLIGHLPFRNWLTYPATAAMTLHGCSYNCVTCGGSACSFRNFFNRQNPAFRSPEKLAADIRSIGKFSKAPVMVLGDIRHAGDDYANRFMEALSGYTKPILFEFYDAPPRSFFERLGKALSHYTVEISMESHDEQVRRAFGRPYSNEQLENSIQYALENGCQRFDLFFMTGIKEQTAESVLDTVEYSRNLINRYSSPNDHRLVPLISPMAPFLDPGSRAFENPKKHGFRMFARTLEEHRQLLLSPSWKYVLNYETKWMNRDQLVAVTYEAGRRLNEIKGQTGVIPADVAEATDARIRKAIQLIPEIDEIVTSTPDLLEQKKKLADLKNWVDHANLSTVCHKGELEVPLRGWGIDLIQSGSLIIKDWMKRKPEVPSIPEFDD